MPLDAARLGAAVRARREQLGLTRDDVADRGGPSDTTLLKIENGAGAVARQTMEKLDRALHWELGSARRAAEGGEPTPKSGDLPRRQLPVSLYKPPSGSELDRLSFTALWQRWDETNREIVVLEYEYARRRGIDVQDALNELEEASRRAASVRSAGPWSPPWEDAERGRRGGFLREVGAAAYEGDPELSDHDDEVHPS